MCQERPDGGEAHSSVNEVTPQCLSSWGCHPPTPQHCDVMSFSHFFTVGHDLSFKCISTASSISERGSQQSYLGSQNKLCASVFFPFLIVTVTFVFHFTFSEYWGSNQSNEL